MGTGALPGLDSGSEALPGPDTGTAAHSGLGVGMEVRVINKRHLNHNQTRGKTKSRSAHGEKTQQNMSISLTV